MKTARPVFPRGGVSLPSTVPVVITVLETLLSRDVTKFHRFFRRPSQRDL